MTAPRRPGLLTDLGAGALALVLVGLAGWLGLWQYDAYRAQRTAEARDLTEADPVALTDVMGNDDPFPAPDIGRPVDVDGEWIPGGFWVAGREQGGTEGYWAVNPLQVGDDAVLVVRGWSPEPSEELLSASGPAKLTGWLQPPEGNLAVDDDPTDDVFPEIRVADAIQRVDVDLYSAYVVDRQAGPGLEAAELASLPSPSRFTGLRNLLYAFEWWIFGAFAAFIWWRWRRDATASPTAEDVTGATPTDTSAVPGASASRPAE